MKPSSAPVLGVFNDVRKNVTDVYDIDVQEVAMETDFKGDLDGKVIWINQALDTSEKLFNLLHLTGHTVQRHADTHLLQLGSVLHTNPSLELIRKLQTYEYEANCYGLRLLHNAWYTFLDERLHTLYALDMRYLTKFYETGNVPNHVLSDEHQTKIIQWAQTLVETPIPSFRARKLIEGTRDGIVINFTS